MKTAITQTHHLPAAVVITLAAIENELPVNCCTGLDKQERLRLSRRIIGHIKSHNLSYPGVKLGYSAGDVAFIVLDKDAKNILEITW